MFSFFKKRKPEPEQLFTTDDEILHHLYDSLKVPADVTLAYKPGFMARIDFVARLHDTEYNLFTLSKEQHYNIDWSWIDCCDIEPMLEAYHELHEKFPCIRHFFVPDVKNANRFSFYGTIREAFRYMSTLRMASYFSEYVEYVCGEFAHALGTCKHIPIDFTVQLNSYDMFVDDNKHDLMLGITDAELNDMRKIIHTIQDSQGTNPMPAIASHPGVSFDKPW